MAADKLPDELRALEDRLARRGPALPEGLRARVLAAVRAEQCARRRVLVSRLTWTAGLAAAIVLVSNCSLAALPYTHCWHRDAAEAALIAQAEQLQALVPELTLPEAQRYVLIRQAGQQATAPLPASHPGRAVRVEL